MRAEDGQPQMLPLDCGLLYRGAEPYAVIPLRVLLNPGPGQLEAMGNVLRGGHAVETGESL